MKRTTLDGKQWILDILLENGIDKIIEGKIYKDERPTDRIAEDIVINSLTMTNEYIQNGVFNVNCYVPKLQLKQNSIVQKKKNYARFKQIAEKVYQALNDVWKEDFNLDIVNHQDFEEEEYSYYNFKIEINAYPQ